MFNMKTHYSMVTVLSQCFLVKFSLYAPFRVAKLAENLGV